MSNCDTNDEVKLHVDPIIFNKDDNGLTDLHQASTGGNRNIVEMILLSGADPNSNNNNGNTPLHFAMIKDNQSIVETFLQNDADSFIESINSINITQSTDDSNNMLSSFQIKHSVPIKKHSVPIKKHLVPIKKPQPWMAYSFQQTENDDFAVWKDSDEREEFDKMKDSDEWTDSDGMEDFIK